MNLSIEAIFSIVSIFVAGGISYGVVKTQCDKLWQEVADIKSWREHHVDFASNCRLLQEKNIGDLRTQVSVSGEQYKEILRRLESIEEKIEILYERRGTRQANSLS